MPNYTVEILKPESTREEWTVNTGEYVPLVEDNLDSVGVSVFVERLTGITVGVPDSNYEMDYEQGRIKAHGGQYLDDNKTASIEYKHWEVDQSFTVNNVQAVTCHGNPDVHFDDYNGWNYTKMPIYQTPDGIEFWQALNSRNRGGHTRIQFRVTEQGSGLVLDPENFGSDVSRLTGIACYDVDPPVIMLYYAEYHSSLPREGEGAEDNVGQPDYPTPWGRWVKASECPNTHWGDPDRRYCY